MRISLLAVGRLKAGPERVLVTRYLDRFSALARNLGLSSVTVVEFEESRARRSDDRIAEEARALRIRLPTGARNIACDGRGRGLDTTAFAAEIARARDEGTRDWALIVGGPDGLDKGLRRDAAIELALGAMTWPHQLVRVLLAEQLYRAASILAGHPYHRE